MHRIIQEIPMRCEDIMKTNPRWVYPETTVETAAAAMRDAGIGFLPVCDAGGYVLGAITDRDLAIRIVARGLPATTQVGAVMTASVVACTADEDIKRVEDRMAQGQVSRLMCVDGVGRLVGVVSLSDIAAHDRAGRAGRTLKKVAEREAHS